MPPITCNSQSQFAERQHRLRMRLAKRAFSDRQEFSVQPFRFRVVEAAPEGFGEQSHGDQCVWMLLSQVALAAVECLAGMITSSQGKALTGDRFRKILARRQRVEMIFSKDVD